MTSTALIVLGASLGGIDAISQVLSGLPEDLAAAVIVAQHRSADGAGMLEALLAKACALALGPATDKEPIEAGRVYVAPPGYHTLIDDARISLDVSDPIRHARPSIDLLFQSAADGWSGRRLVGTLLTASSEDGARGIEAIAAADGTTIVQDPTSAESDVAIRHALRRTRVDHVVPLREIARLLCQLTGTRPQR